MQPSGTMTSNITAEKIVAAVGELPASPAIVSAVMGLTSSVETEIEKIVKVLSADQALTAKVLKLSNSSFYGRCKGVSTLREAILILGFYTLRSLVIASSTRSLYKKKESSSLERALWEHSVATGIACKVVAQRICHSSFEEAFIAGLMHDLGKLILSQRMPVEYNLVVDEVVETGRTFMDVERERIGFSHVDVAKALFDKWNFPSFLSSAIYFHHNPEAEPNDAKSKIPISYIVQFGDQVARHIGCGFNDVMVKDLTSLPLALLAVFSEDDIDPLIDKIGEIYQAERNVFDS